MLKGLRLGESPIQADIACVINSGVQNQNRRMRIFCGFTFRMDVMKNVPFCCLKAGGGDTNGGCFYKLNKISLFVNSARRGSIHISKNNSLLRQRCPLQAATFFCIH